MRGLTGSDSGGRSGAPSRLLIVNADDFGRSDAVNRGVAEGFRRGIVTSTSIVANGPAFASAVALSRELAGLGIGVHLTIDEYEPVLPPAEIASLVTNRGCFPGRGRQFVNMGLFRRARDDLLREWDAQIDKVMSAGITVTHLDGHGHCHAHPAAADAVLALAQRYGITHVRMPVEPLRWRAGRVPPGRIAAKVALSLAARRARRLWQRSLSFPTTFYGFSHGGHVSRALVERVAKEAPVGISELMVHVAVSNDERPGFLTGYDWTGDLAAVTAFEKGLFEQEFGVKLIAHTGRGSHAGG
jgi:predicted glycoside hydrolase/deacetylase ChbG (UPF0249 family)